MEVFCSADKRIPLRGETASRFKRRNRLVLMTLAIAAVVLPAAAQDKDQKHSNKSVGFTLSGEANAHDVGLPLYPGAQRHKDTSDDSSALQMGLWGGNSAFKIVLLKLDSDDAPEKVAAFYRKALAKYGKVLDCKKSEGTKEKTEKDSANASHQIRCQDDQALEGGFTLKAGTKERQHIVGVEPRGSHSTVSLVYLESPNSDNKAN